MPPFGSGESPQSCPLLPISSYQHKSQSFRALWNWHIVGVLYMFLSKR